MAFGVDDAIAAALKIADKFIPDPAAKAAYEKELRADFREWDKSQTEVNAVEAANANMFVAGWRPALGWTCAFAFAFIYVVGPLITWASTLYGRPVPLPSFNVDALMSLTLGMLGLAGMRAYEKVKGVAK